MEHISHCYGCETRSVILREEHRFRVLEKRLLDDPTVRCESDQLRWDAMAGRTARMGEIRNPYKILVGKPEGKDHMKNNFEGKIV
jgi:hypothetical protein